MKNFIQSLMSPKGVLNFLAIVVIVFFILRIFRLHGISILFLGIAILLFYIFVIYVLFTRREAKIGWKIFLWLVLALIAIAIISEILETTSSPAEGAPTVIAVLFSIPLLHLGLYGLFKSERKKIN